MKIATMVFISCVGLLVVACNAAEPTPIPTPVSTPLPTAVPPSEPTGTWGLSFSQEFPSDFWDGGSHRYGFHIACKTLTYDTSTEWQTFTVTQNAPAQPYPIYFRLAGLSVEPFVPAYQGISRISLDQPTIAIVHLLGLTEEQVEIAASDCEVLFSWDQAPPVSLTPLEPFQP